MFALFPYTQCSLIKIIEIHFARYSSQACTPTYKAAVDYTWRQLVLLQQMGFVVYAQALEIMSRPTEHSAKQYKKRAALQVRMKFLIYFTFLT